MKSSIIKVLLVNTAILVGLLLLLEIFFRLFYSDKILFEKDFRHTLQGVQEHTRYVLYDAGYRSTKYIDFSEKGEDTVRIICIGASTVDQPTQSNEDIWCSIIAQLLSKEIPEINVETATFAVPGWWSVNNLMWAEKYLGTVDADISISLLGINDMLFSSYLGEGYNGLESRKKSVMEIFASDERYSMYPHTGYKYLFRKKRQKCAGSVLCERLFNFYVSIKKEKKAYLEYHSKHLDSVRSRYLEADLLNTLDRNPDPIHEFEDVVSELAKVHSQNNISFIMLGQPVMYSSSVNDPNENLYWFTANAEGGNYKVPSNIKNAEMEKYNAVQEKVAADYKFRYLNLNQQVPKSPEYFFDDCHFTDKGNALVAELVYPFVKDAVLAEMDSRAAREN